MSDRVVTLSIMMKDADGNRRVFEFSNEEKIADLFTSDGKVGSFLSGLKNSPTPNPDEVTDSKAEVG